MDFAANDEGISLINFAGSQLRSINAVLLGDTEQSVVLRGLPVVGVRLASFINERAQPGVLANYTFAERLRARPGTVQPSN